MALQADHAPGPTRDAITLVHLSDIHLAKAEVGVAQDLNEDIRRKLEADLQEPSLALSSGVDGIVITGDIAHAGRTEEYASAHSWLKGLCAKVNCPPSRVWTVPGNHDVSRVSLSRSLLDSHEAIRRGDAPAKLHERLMDGGASRMLFEPFENYNHFARSFTAGTGPADVYWESNELLLNDASILRLRGLNSSLISDATDDLRIRPYQVLGLKQVQLADDDPGVCYLTLCHHPPSWLYDEREVEDHLNSRARIQLYGHEHRQRPRTVDNSLVIFAGSLHPDRGEKDWEPRYNVLKLSVTNSPHRVLLVQLFARVWKPAETRFGPDPDSNGTYPREYLLTLPSWTHPGPMVRGPPVPKEPTATSIPMADKPEDLPNLRDMVYALFELSYPVRMRILLDLGLVEARDEHVTDSELIRRALERAVRENRIAELARSVERAARQSE